MDEQWRPVIGSDWHEVSDHGRVRSWVKPGVRPITRASEPRLLSTPPRHGGYREVQILGVFRRVHLLVLESFVGPCPEGLEGRHLDNDPSNNRATNLCWSTHAANMADQRIFGTTGAGEQHPQHRLSDADVAEIRRSYAAHEGSQSVIGRRFGISQSYVGRLVSGDRR